MLNNKIKILARIFIREDQKKIFKFINFLKFILKINQTFLKSNFPI